MKKYLYIILSCVILFSSCMATKFENRVTHIEIGMTKDEVRSIMGKNYKVQGGANTPDGKIETWTYQDGSVMVSQYSGIVINFLNNRVDEWHREYGPSTPPPAPHDH